MLAKGSGRYDFGPIHPTWVVPYFQKTGKIFTISVRSKMDMTFGK